MRDLNRFYLKLLFIIVILSYMVFLSGFTIVRANGIHAPLIVNDNFNMEEFTVVDEFKENKNSIDIQLPSTSWKIQDIDLNFSGIQFAEEIEIIENTTHNMAGNYSRLWYQNTVIGTQGLGVQINLVEPTTLYGVYIFGYQENRSYPVNVQVQIRGYDIVNNRPNSSIYHSQGINMSSPLGWYLQTFTPELNLPEGKYFLVLNATDYDNQADHRYYWYRNNVDPKFPELYSSEQTVINPWSIGIQNAPFLYKLHQKINTPKYPETINMTINVNDVDYQISNGPEEGTGILLKTTVNFFPNSDTYDIVVSNNVSDSLLFNVSCKITLYHEFIAPGTILIDGSLSNLWIITPTITRQSNNHSILFYFPTSWENISLLKNAVNITLDAIIDTSGHYLLITNDSITNGASWEIIAQSPRINISLNIQRTKFELGQELRFSLLTPVPGQYTFVLYDSAATEINRTLITYPPDSTTYSYKIATSGLDGIYIAYVFWYNGEDAGFQFQEFTISVPTNPTPDFPFLPLILLILVIGASIGVGGFIAYKKLSSMRRDKLEAILDKCTDITNINYIIVLDSRSGIDLFSQSFGGKKLDPTLLSGFLQAIRTFGTEMSEEAKESRTLKLEYKDSIILMTEFVNLKLIITLKENPSTSFKYLMEDLAYDIYNQYGKEIDKFSGNLKPFSGIKKLTEKHLNVSFLYPMTVVQNLKVKLSNVEEEMVERALVFIRENKFDYFYSLYLMPENVCTPKDYHTIIQLINKGIFKPIESNSNKY